MVKITIPGIFTTLYTECEDGSCIQKSIKIPGTAGKQIKVTELTLSMCVASKGTTATGWVTADIKEASTVVATWTETNTIYKNKSATPGVFAGPGEDVTLNWNLKTSNGAVRSKIANITYSYTLLDTEPTTDECLVVVRCETQEEADAIAGSLTDKGVSVYTKKSN